MTTTLFITVPLIALLMFAMAIGVIFSNRELKGSCGGAGSCACEEAETEVVRACDVIPGPGEERCLPEQVAVCEHKGACPHEQHAA